MGKEIMSSISVDNHKKSKPIGLDFFICAVRHNIVCVLARNII